MANTLTSYVARNVGTSATTIYTVPGSTTSTLIGLLISNVTTGSVNVTATLTRSALVYNIVKGALVPAGGALPCVGVEGKIVLLAGDIIKVNSDVATSVDVIVSCLEQS